MVVQNGVISFLVELMFKHGYETVAKKMRLRQLLQAQQAYERRLPDYSGGASTPPLRYYPRADYWKGTTEQAHLTSVVSGKGGVGKTLVSLGLAELQSKYERVLLLDFDLHNRGLTSKLVRIPLKDGTRCVFDELTHYHDSICKARSAEEIAGLKKSGLKGIDRATFYRERNRFSYRDPALQDDLRSLSPLPVPRREEPALSPASRKVWEFGRNVHVMPSRRRGQLFLGSEVSSLDAVEVAVFLKYLACLAFRQGYHRVIVDGHGAHDMYTTGAILASDDLVVVSEPDEGALLGTYELLAFADKFVRHAEALPNQAVLIVNGVREGESESVKRTVEELSQLLRPGEDVGGTGRSDEAGTVLTHQLLSHDEMLRAHMKCYAFPTVCMHDSAWMALISASDALGLSRNPNGSPQALAVSASDDAEGSSVPPYSLPRAVPGGRKEDANDGQRREPVT